MSLKEINKFLGGYALATVTYGFIRTVAYDHDNWMKEYYNRQTREYKTRDMLYNDAIGLVVTRSLCSFWRWPLLLKEDFTTLECILRGKERLNYQDNPYSKH